MMEYLENVSRNALEQMDIQGTMMEKLKNAIAIVWQETNDVLKLDKTVQHIKEAMEIFGDNLYHLNMFENLNINQPAVYTTATVSLIMLLVVTIVTVRAFTDAKYSDSGPRQKVCTSPAKVLSIFELAKTAYRTGHAEEVMMLVDRLKFDVNFPIPTTGMSLVLCACISGEKTLVEFLLKRGGDISSVNSDGDSCLYLATFASGNDANSELIKLLIKRGCRINGQNYKGNTALHLAASRGNINLISTLLSCGADSERTNNFGIYPFDCATHAGHTEAAKMLRTSKQI